MCEKQWNSIEIAKYLFGVHNTKIHWFVVAVLKEILFICSMQWHYFDNIRSTKMQSKIMKEKKCSNGNHIQ